MVAIPGLCIIQHTHKEIRPQHCRKLHLSSRCSCDGIAEWPCHLRQDTCPQQKVLYLRSLLRQDFFTHIIEEKAVGEAPRAQKRGGIRVSTQSQQEQLTPAIQPSVRSCKRIIASSESVSLIVRTN